MSLLFLQCAVLWTQLLILTTTSYFAGNTEMSFSDSILYCEDQGSELASFSTKRQFTSMQETCRESAINDCWIGLWDDDTTDNIEGPYAFIDGTTLNYGFNNDGSATRGRGPWNHGEPNSASLQICIQVWKDEEYMLDDDYCYESKTPICNGDKVPTMSPTAEPTYDESQPVISTVGSGRAPFGGHSQIIGLEEQGFLVGKWMNLVSIDETGGAEFYGVHHVDIIKHTLDGVVEAVLVQTDFFRNGHQESMNREYGTFIYSGMLQNDTLTLNYEITTSDYTAELILNVNEYSMDGTWQHWNDGVYRGTGTTKWIKAEELVMDEVTEEIWLIGGYAGTAHERIISFDRSEESFTDYLDMNDTLGIKPRAFCMSQCSTQIGEYIYWMNHDDNQNVRKGFNAFNRWTMSSSIYEPGWNSVESPFNMDQYSCLASLDVGDGYLIVTDEHAGIYDIGAGEWMENVPDMNFPRSFHACTVNPKTRKLYVISGSTILGDPTDTIEELYINLRNIGGMSWYLWDETLVNGAKNGLRALFDGGYIYVIGGTYVELIDVEARGVSIYGQLAIPVSMPAVIRVKQIVYLFGGDVGSDETKQWQYFPLLTTSSESAAKPEIMNYVEEGDKNDFDGNSKGVSYTELFFASALGDSFMILCSVAVGVYIGRKMKSPSHQYEKMNISETEAM